MVEMGRKESREDNRDVFDKALEYAPEALVAAGTAGAAGVIGSRLARAAKNKGRMQKAGKMRLQPTEGKLATRLPSTGPSVVTRDADGFFTSDLDNAVGMNRRRR